MVESATRYEPYGDVLKQTGTSGTVYGFTGEQEDSATGQLYLRARYYSPQLKVFQSRDPWEGSGWRPGTLNYYLYVNNNPVKFVDPSGHCSGSPGGQNSYEENLCWAMVYTIDAQWDEWWERRFGSKEMFWELASIDRHGTNYWFEQLNYYYQSDYYQANLSPAYRSDYSPLPMEVLGDVGWGLSVLELGSDTYNQYVELAGDAGRVLPGWFGSSLVVASSGLEGGAAGHSPGRVLYDMAAACVFDIAVDYVAAGVAATVGGAASVAFSPFVGAPLGAVSYVAVQYFAMEPVDQATKALWLSFTTPSMAPSPPIQPVPIPTPGFYGTPPP